MAKRDLFKKKFLGWLISLINVYPVNREKADTHALTGGVKMVDEKKSARQLGNYFLFGCISAPR